MKLALSKEFKIGLIFIVALAIFYWGFNFMKGNDVFSKAKSFYAIYNNTEGLSPGQSLQINGLSVGQIDEIYFHPDMSSRVVVKLKMTQNYPLPKNSIASIHSSGLLGEKNIQLLLGNSQALAENGDTLATRTESTLGEAVNEQVAPIKAKAENLLATLDTAVTMLTGFLNEDSRSNFKASLASLSKTFESFNESAVVLERILDKNEPKFNNIIANFESITTNLDSNSENISAVLGNLNAVTDSLKQANIKQTLMQFDDAVAQLDDVMTKINNGDGTIGMLVNDPELYNNLEAATESLDRLLLDIKYNPKKYVNVSVFGKKGEKLTEEEIEALEEERKQKEESKKD